MVDLFGKLLLLLLAHALCISPVVKVHALAFTVAAFAILLLLENVEHLFAVHATETLVDQPHRVALLPVDHGHVLVPLGHLNGLAFGV